MAEVFTIANRRKGERRFVVEYRSKRGMWLKYVDYDSNHLRTAHKCLDYCRMRDPKCEWRLRDRFRMEATDGTR